MNEKLVIELVAIIAALVWLLRLTIQQQSFKKNHIHEMEKRLTALEASFKTEVDNMKEDIRSLFQRLNDHINGVKK